jgi:hypothetical protein
MEQLMMRFACVAVAAARVAGAVIPSGYRELAFARYAPRGRGNRASSAGPKEANMPAYLIVEHTITDPAKFQEYGTKVRPLDRKVRRSISSER